MKKYRFETENDDLLKQVQDRLDGLKKLSREERIADLIDTGILTADGQLAPEYKPPEER